MVKTKRNELEDPARQMSALRCHTQRPGGDQVWGFKVMRSLELSGHLAAALPGP
ncbi:hypothetical protein GGE65_002765 [Skermanella aerolata]|uniref:hypothetical protein n=1 Tax=Skermanella aerolata TaxID=393310 RepID=UPI0012F72A87|nr:hypothetical protein [Skermanella aerolata]